jgi:diguanylate cyclase (GGDEF)-like protein
MLWAHETAAPRQEPRGLAHEGDRSARQAGRSCVCEFPRSGDRKTGISGAIVGMSAGVRVVRGPGALVAIGFQGAAVLAIVLWLDLHGAALDTSIPAAVVLVGLTILAKRIKLVVAPRTSVSIADPFIVAASLVGGPLVGACAGVSTDAGAGALQGFAVGLVGEQLAQRGVSGAVAIATLGLLTGFALNSASTVLVAHGRGVKPLPALLASWRTSLLIWVLPAPLLVAFLYIFDTTPALASAFAAGLLVLVAAGNISRLGLERTLAKERSRARLDALTHAPNRYALAEALAAEQARIGRGGRTAAICFLDLDRFKTDNDSYGYAAGDRLLVDVYQRLREQLRATDLVFRWGGEEFVVLAPHVESVELADFAERLRLLIATRPFSIEGRPRTITGSVGAVLLEESRPAQAALEAAGHLVRRAKLTRNAAVVDATTDPRSTLAAEAKSG